MKAIILVVCLSALSFSNVRAADECCENKTASLEQRLRDIDLGIALKQYEEIQTEKAKTEVQIILMRTELASSGEDLEKNISMLTRRVELLTQYTDELRAKILDLGKTVAVAAK